MGFFFFTICSAAVSSMENMLRMPMMIIIVISHGGFMQQKFAIKAKIALIRTKHTRCRLTGRDDVVGLADFSFGLIRRGHQDFFVLATYIIVITPKPER